MPWFPTKEAATAHFKAILHRYEPGQRLSDADTIELMRILKRHPDYAQKVGAGVAALGVRSAAYGSQCFEIIRTDDTRTDFSYRVCINGKPSSPLAEAKQAMRAEVNDDIAHAKQQYFAAYGDAEGKVACAVTGEFVTTKTAH